MRRINQWYAYRGTRRPPTAVSFQSKWAERYGCRVKKNGSTLAAPARRRHSGLEMRQLTLRRFANLADQSLRRLASESWGPQPPDLAARDSRFDDGHLVTADVGKFAPNAFGLYDMCGNVAEWTLGQYGERGDRRTVRGGSWRDLPQDAHVSDRFGYHPYQKVFNVGFRVVVEDD